MADCQAVLVARIGECGVDRLAERGIEAYELPGPIDPALRQVTEGGLTAVTGVCAAHGRAEANVGR